MKCICITLLTASLVVHNPALAQDEGAAEKTNQGTLPTMSANQQAFLNLPEEKRKEFIEHISHASRMFQQKRIFECMDKLDEADKIFAESVEVMNLRGSCFVEIRAFDKAMDEFQKAIRLSPGNNNLQFNIAEVYFVTDQWQKAFEAFQKALKGINEQNIQMSRLVEFKILLCLKKIGRNADARILAEKYDYLDDSPFYYYANAAIAYDDEDLAKAEEWLAMAARIFRNSAVLAPWQDTLVEYGYIKSFYGEEAAVAEP